MSSRRTNARSSDRVAEHRLVVPVLRVAEWAAVARRPVEVVVESLGDHEEVGVALDHQPSGIDADPPDVREQRLEEFGDAPAGRGRVDVEHLPSEEPDAGLAGEPLERPDPRGSDDGFQVLGRDLADVHLFE